MFTIIMLLIIAVFSLFGFSSQLFLLTRADRQTYRAAVYEHEIILPPHPDVKVSRKKALHNMMINLNVYEIQASKAAQQGADILVFPEDGIHGYKFITRDTVAPYLEYIPDPRYESWTPCDEPGRYNNSDVQVILSCLAKRHSIYLVANIGDAQPCVQIDPNCPHDGQYQYNTDIAFDRSGKLIARYHKQNLYFEYQFDEPVNPEYIYFDTDFGRFGLFTCFDIIFHEPAIPLLEEHNITDVAFPTAWKDALPFFSAIGYHSSFAVANKVNFLAANLHRPQERFQGSGIYTPMGPKIFYYNRSNRTQDDGRLLVADVPVQHPRRRSHTSHEQPPISSGLRENHCLTSNVFKSTSFYDWYNFVIISAEKGNKLVCQQGFCCYLEYEREDSGEMYALGIFNGIHKRNGPYYLQVCMLLRCASSTQESCGSLNFYARTRFNHFKLYGNFSTPYVNPQVLLSNNGSLELAQIGTWQYDSNTLQGSSTVSPLLSTILVGRIYVRDTIEACRQGQIIKVPKSKKQKHKKN